MKHVYFFGGGVADGNAQMKDILGGKGANLAEMTNLGIPVPPGFTISAKLCLSYLDEGKLPDDARAEANSCMARLEELCGRKFGDAEDPLLVSVRSGAKDSMPGMMDTILNLGLNDRTVEGLAERSANRRFAFDSYRRFIQMHGEVVAGIGGSGGNPFEEALAALKERRGVRRDIDLQVEDLESLVEQFRDIYREQTGQPFPEDPWVQVRGAVEAVFKSWHTPRAREYRRVHKVPEDMGTAVNVQAMVYGNMGEDSGTGVVFTRDPSTGEDALFGEFLLNAQGEDVVAGIRDPEPIGALKRELPEIDVQLRETCHALERHYRDLQDIEFTVERGTLYILQTRTGKRSAGAAVRIAVEMAETGLIDHRIALRRVTPAQIDQLLHPMVDPKAEVDLLVTGLPASPGAAAGIVVFDAESAVSRAGQGESVVLVRRETSADDFTGMVASAAILTARGGMTSHAAVVARGMGKTCVAGAKEMLVDEAARSFDVNGRTVREGEWITVDGSTGRVLAGKPPLVQPDPGPEFGKLMSWADDCRRLGVRGNADTPRDAARAREFGAEGIGLCRTEHMFFGEDRIEAMREMILAGDPEQRRKALARLLPMQREDFAGILRAMAGFPVTIRLLDPPLHEFLPGEPDEQRELADAMGLTLEDVQRAVQALSESNPMLGHRGCRLGISYPEITAMQARAIFEAACQLDAEGIDVRPEVMVPLVSHVEELQRQAELVRATARQVFREQGREVGFLVGTMIELPRAALTADDIARVSEFFSFGTNDLTQCTFGLSRDDAGRFLPQYVASGILPSDPFQTLDEEGVGKLVETAVRLGRSANPEIHLGICGEHGGDPASIDFCHRAGLDYVSCSPFRVPVARLSAAHSALRDA